MPLLFFALLLLGPLDLLREPEYSVVRHGQHWVVQKPGAGTRNPVIISRHPSRRAAESRMRRLPRVRINRPFVRFQPASSKQTPVADWSHEADALEIGSDVHAILERFVSAETRKLLESTSVYAARLFGASGHTAEVENDPGRFVVYLDPFRATGRLHVASTFVHEFTHVERYRSRGFHANRAAAVLPKRDFVLLGLVDELAAYQAEAHLVRSFMHHSAVQEGHSHGNLRQAVRDALRTPALNWPVALTVLLGFEGPQDENARLAEVHRQVALALADNASRYWEARHTDVLEPALREKIRNWHHGSREWKEIEAGRAEWHAGGQ